MFDTIGMIDTLIVDCNTLMHELTSGHYIAFCVKLVEMVQKLNTLKKGVKEDFEEKDKTIADLQRLIEGRESEDV